MDNQFQEKLNELASKFGTTSNDLYSWLTNTGLPNYANVTIVRLSITIAICTILLILSFIVMRKLVLANNDELFILVGIPLMFVVVISFSLIAISIPDLIGWLMSPDGMIVNSFLVSMKG